MILRSTLGGMGTESGHTISGCTSMGIGCHCTKLCCSSTISMQQMKCQQAAVGNELFIEMSSFAAQDARRSAGFVFEPKKNAGFIMMLWLLGDGNVLTGLTTSKFLTEYLST